MNNKYLNFIQGGKFTEDGECIEFTVKEIIKFYSRIRELREILQNRYEKSVKKLQQIQYRVLAAKCVFKLNDTNCSNKTFKNIAYSDYISAKKEQKVAEFEHINCIKPQFMGIRAEDDRWLELKKWVWNTCEKHCKKNDHESIQDWLERIYKITVKVYVEDVYCKNGNRYIVYIEQFNERNNF